MAIITKFRSYSDGPLCRSHRETSEYVSTLILLSSVKIVSKSLNRKDVQFGLDRAHVFIIDRYFACKRESLFLVLFVAQFLSRYCRPVKADLFFCQNDSGHFEDTYTNGMQNYAFIRGTLY